MLKDLIKLANRLDQAGLTKEADLLDNIIRKASNNSGEWDVETYEGPITPIFSSEEIRQMISSDKTEYKDILENFKDSCLTLKEEAVKILTPEAPEKLNDYLPFLDPRFPFNEEELIEAFGEERVAEFLSQELNYSDPEDFISAANSIINESPTNRYILNYPKIRARAKRLLDNFGDILDKMF